MKKGVKADIQLNRDNRDLVNRLLIEHNILFTCINEEDFNNAADEDVDMYEELVLILTSNDESEELVHPGFYLNIIKDSNTVHGYSIIAPGPSYKFSGDNLEESILQVISMIVNYYSSLKDLYEGCKDNQG